MSRTPYVPRKPAEYAAHATQPSMNDLLQSLNIDDVEHDYASRRQQTSPVREHGSAIFSARPIDTRPLYANTPAANDSAQARNSALTSTADFSDVASPRQGNKDIVNNYGEGGSPRLRQTPSKRESIPADMSKPSETSPQSQRVQRKPVDTTPTRKVWYCPDDLDELIPKSGRDTSQDDRSNRPLPMPASGYRDTTEVPYNQYNGFQSPSAYANGPDQYMQYGQPAHGPMDRSSQHVMSPPDLRASGPSVYGRSPSPTYRASMPNVTARPPANYPSALEMNYDLAPRGTNGPYLPRSLSRQNMSPTRSQSSLSNHSQRSPERPNPYNNHIHNPAGSLSSIRIPSPDRNVYYADAPESPVVERVNTASIPPSAQARRGRQKGEIVAESDLPAMPLLFTESRKPEYEYDYEAPLQVQQPYPQDNASPSRSPTRNSNILPNLSPRKRSSFARAPDCLQSVKVLPIKPIKCPPLCLEERYHPYAFVKTNKFKIKVFPAQSTFVAGGELFGHIDIVSEEGFRAQFGSTQVVVGEIGVEVIGYEEIQHSESGHNPRSFTFLYSRKVFQSMAETHPGRAAQEQILTSAVLNDPPPDQDGFRTASKGTSSFPFAFPLPIDAPSSADLNVARIKYLITGYATVKLQGSHEIMATSVPVRVVEAWDVGNPIYEQPIEAAQGRDIANYHEIAGTAQIPRSLYTEGETLMGNVRIANHSSKKIRDVKFLLINRITLFGDKRSPAFDLNPPEDFTLEQTATGHVEPHAIAKGDFETWNFSLYIPPEKCLSVRNTALFEINPEVLIKISTGPLQKSTRLYIPQISIASPDSMINNQDRVAPKSAMMRWATLPFLYRFQRIMDGAVQSPEKGSLDVTDLITYYTAQERVALLSSSE